MIAIDLGSNTFRCIEYDCTTKRFGRDFERIVRTADRIHETGVISEASIERVIAAAREARNVLDFETHKVMAVTTAAMRMAKNSAEVLERIEKEGGVRFEIIDDAAEAAYTMRAVRNRLEMLELPAEDFVLIDIGGGSTEVMFYRGGSFESRSFPVGIVTIAQQCSGPETVREALKTALKPVEDYVGAYYGKYGKPQTFVATAGTPTTIAAFLKGMTYETYDAHKINGTVLSLEQCDEALKGLLALDDETRAVYVGVGKETLIVAGVVIVEAFYELLGFEKAIIVDDGLREGVAIASCEG
jgi:exopolyphosphatase/guanosine-5'-triphosphate,3'-diphosphate pyrophosphatase